MSGVPEEGIVAADDDLARLGARTSLMALDLLLASVPSGGAGYAEAAAQARSLAGRVAVATGDLAEIIRKAG